MDYIIPCDTVARLAHVLAEPDEEDKAFTTIRIENGVALASNRAFIAVEQVIGGDGIIHLIVDDILLAQCRAEAPHKSTLTVTVVDALKFATAKTTFGYVHPHNCVMWLDAPTLFDGWRDIVEQARHPATASVGGMIWHPHEITALAESSPSKIVAFETNIDCGRASIIRDVYDPAWFGVFRPISKKDAFPPATFPTWF